MTYLLAAAIAIVGLDAGLIAGYLWASLLYRRDKEHLETPPE